MSQCDCNPVENGGYALVGHVKYIAAFDERFPQYVRQEQKKAIESILSEGSKSGNSRLVEEVCTISFRAISNWDIEL